MSALRRMMFAGLIAIAGAGVAQAADTAVSTSSPPPPRVAAVPATNGAAVAAPNGVAVAAPASPIVGPPSLPFGCQRIWRCDAQVCEWRRGCNGVYGYVEGPYYNKPLAERQWARDYLPGPGTNTAGVARSRTRAVTNPELK